MKHTRLIMGMPVSVEVVSADDSLIASVFKLFTAVDNQFSPYKEDSEVSAINRGLSRKYWSKAMRRIIDLCEQTKHQTNGYFDITHNGQIDPSGLVKGWAIQQAANLLWKQGAHNFCIEAGGDIQVSGQPTNGSTWQIGIRNPFNQEEVVKVIELNQGGIATSGTAVRGQHIYNPKALGQTLDDIASITVIGPTIYDADRFATAAFAMGREGINFIARLTGFEAYAIDHTPRATMTNGFERYVRDA